MKCNNCNKDDATKKCGRCKAVYYCSKECQKANWKAHKIGCVVSSGVKLDNKDLVSEGKDPLGEHKKLFQQIVDKYGLFDDDKAGEIADFLIGATEDNPIMADQFAKKYGMTENEAILFLSWIKRGQSVFNR